MDAIGKIKQLFIYKSEKGLKPYGTKIDWQPDIYNLIENLFLPIHYPNGGYVLIDKYGNYLIQRGEYCYSEAFINDLNFFMK